MLIIHYIRVNVVVRLLCIIGWFDLTFAQRDIDFGRLAGPAPGWTAVMVTVAAGTGEPLAVITLPATIPLEVVRSGPSSRLHAARAPIIIKANILINHQGVSAIRWQGNTKVDLEYWIRRNTFIPIHLRTDAPHDARWDDAAVAVDSRLH
jgi:hypothetical protein